LAACRFGGEDVVQADQIGLARELAAGQQGAVVFAAQRQRLEGHGRKFEPLRVGLALRQRRAAQLANGLRKGAVAQRLPDQARRQRLAGQPIERRAHHHARVVDACPALRFELTVEFVRLREGRDAQHHRQLRFVEHGLRQLLHQGQAPGRNGVDAARALGLARRKAHQPAVEPTLLRRRAGVEAGVLDARQQRWAEARREAGAGLHARVFMRSTISRANSM
jgi:hypothetical protein